MLVISGLFSFSLSKITSQIFRPDKFCSFVRNNRKKREASGAGKGRVTCQQRALVAIKLLEGPAPTMTRGVISRQVDKAPGNEKEMDPFHAGDSGITGIHNRNSAACPNGAVLLRSAIGAVCPISLWVPFFRLCFFFFVAVPVLISSLFSVRYGSRVGSLTLICSILPSHSFCVSFCSNQLVIRSFLSIFKTNLLFF